MRILLNRHIFVLNSRQHAHDFVLVVPTNSITIQFSIYNGMGHTSSLKTTNRSAGADDPPFIGIFSPAQGLGAMVFSFLRSAIVPILSHPPLPGRASGSSVSAKTWSLGRGREVPTVVAAI